MSAALDPSTLLFDPADLLAWSHLDAGQAQRELQTLLERAVAQQRLPGAVAWAERLGDGAAVSWRAGHRAVEPSPEPLAPDTVFDVASLTKGIVTATVFAHLFESGEIDPDQSLAALWPQQEDVQPGVTLRHLLTHTAGLAPCLPLERTWGGLEGALNVARRTVLSDPPGTVFRYSDIGFILLPGVAQRVTGVPLEQLASDWVLGPCGMDQSHFLPLQHGVGPSAIAPTETDENGHWLRGVVHDPVCRRMGGVGGHAGLFSTVADVARYARMVLRGGVNDAGQRVLSESAVRRMTELASPPGLPARSLGWDIDSPYARARGRVHGPRSFGHTAFTGCALWMDPEAQCLTVLLSNRVHTAPTRSIVDLYEAVATLGARSVRAESSLKG